MFVVGVPRSGTSLLRAVLNRHSQVAIAGESNYLGNLVWWQGARHRFRRLGSLEDDATIRRLADLVGSERFAGGTIFHRQEGFWHWLRKGVARDELEARLLAGERSERGVFAVLLRTYADARHRPIMGEKTPAHFRWAGDLLEWFPAGRVVHIVRDPRAVYRSGLKRLGTIHSFPYSVLGRVPPVARGLILLEVAWAWSLAVSRHRALAAQYPDRYVLVRFEDLVTTPDAEVRRLCERLGLAPEPGMLRQKVVSRGDRLGESGFDAGAADRWRDQVTAREARWLRRLLGRRIEEMGYPQA